MDLIHAGLTTRPAQHGTGVSQYSLAAQADLILHLCTACAISQVTLMGHSDGALLALMAAAAASRITKDEPPHVVIDMHASTPVQRAPLEAELAAKQHAYGAQQTSGPLPVVLGSQQVSGGMLHRYAMQAVSHHVGNDAYKLKPRFCLCALKSTMVFLCITLTQRRPSTCQHFFERCTF